MNDNAELLKFAVENIEEWPEDVVWLSSSSYGFCFSQNCVDYRKDHFFGVPRPRGLIDYFGVILREEWEEARKENDKSKPENSNTFTKSMLEVGKHVVITRQGHILFATDKVLNDLNDDLTSYDAYVEDIMAVYQLVWSREDSEKETKRKKLEEEVKKLEQELKLKKEELENANK